MNVGPFSVSPYSDLNIFLYINCSCGESSQHSAFYNEYLLAVYCPKHRKITIYKTNILRLFDVITSFSAVYIWSWTTAHRHPRTAIRVP